MQSVPLSARHKALGLCLLCTRAQRRSSNTAARLRSAAAITSWLAVAQPPHPNDAPLPNPRRVEQLSAGRPSSGCTPAAPAVVQRHQQEQRP